MLKSDSTVNTKEKEPASYNNFMGTMAVTKEELDAYVKSIMDQPAGPQPKKGTSIKDILNQFLSESHSLKDQYNLSKDQLEGMYSLGYQAFNQGNYKQAIGLFRLLFLLNPVDVKYTFSLGLSLEKSKKFFEAATSYILNGYLDEQNPIPFFRTGICFLELGENAASANMFEQAIAKCAKKEEYKTLKERAQLFLLGLNKTAKA